MSDFWLKCDSCNRENVGVTFVNGMRFCAKCYQETFGNTNPFYENDLRNKIANLEAKLAEMGREIAIRNKKLNELKNELHKRDESLKRKKQQVCDVHKAVKQAKKESARKGRQVCYVNNEVVQYQKQIKQFKQQLADKDKEIESLNAKLKAKDICFHLVNGPDKISFCIERLGKVKEYCRQEAYHDSYGDYMIVYERRYYEDDEEKTPNDDLMGFLDNQIKQLTHQHEDKGE